MAPESNKVDSSGIESSEPAGPESTPTRTPPPSHSQPHSQPDQPRSVAAARAATIEGVQARMARTHLHQAEVDRQYKDEMRWLQKEVEHLKAELEVSRRRRADADDDIAALKAQLEAAKQEAVTSEAEAAEARARAEAMRKDGSRAEVERLRGELEASRKAAASAATEATEAQRVAAAAMKELRAVQAEFAARGSKLAEVEAAAARAAEEVAALRERCEEAVAAQQGLERELSQARVEQRTMAGKLEVVTRDLAVARGEAEARAAELAAAQQRLAGAAEAQAEAEAAVAEATSRSNAVQTELDELKTLSGMSAASIQAMKNKLERVEGDLAELQTSYSKVVYEHAKARAEHTEMGGKLLRAQEELGRYLTYHDEVVSALRRQLTAAGLDPQLVSDPPAITCLARYVPGSSSSSAGGGGAGAAAAGGGPAGTPGGSSGGSARRLSLGTRGSGGSAGGDS